MPSPIAHAAAGYAIYKVYEARHPEKATGRLGPASRLLVAIIGLSFLPDLDFIPGLILNDLSRFHNNLSHSLSFGLLTASTVGCIVWLKNRSDFTFWFVLALVCYQLHIFMDFFTVGRGLMIFWPFSVERYQPPFMLFYGLHRSAGWVSIRHVWTFLTEAAFTGFMYFLFRRVIVSVKPVQQPDDQISPLQ